MSRKGLLGCLVALALLAALATGASAQAAGTRLCKTNVGTTCGAVYASGSKFVGTGAGSISLPGVTACSNSTIEFEISAMGTGAESIEISLLTGTNCTGPCLVAGAGPVGAEVEASGTGPSGLATVAGSPGLVVGCNGGSFRCEYQPKPSALPLIAGITGGTFATVKVSGVTMELLPGGSLGCPTETSLSMFQKVGPKTGTDGVYVKTV
ncbi:MAG TPA: hypothetical protein VGI73_04705 [Solirubrobacterales bacterium]|jgi:hypothetical protein